MSILDDAIREHLELKRAHGADDAELKKLEDEAFGPPGRPDDPNPFSEEPTEFLAAPATDASDAAAEATAEPGGRRVPNIADLQEAPPPPIPEVEDAPAADQDAAEQPSGEQTIPVPHAEAAPEVEEATPPEASAEEDDGAPASEHATPAPEGDTASPIDAGHSTEEREAIAEQPTELFDVEADLGAGAERRSPTDEQLLDSKLSEPRLAPIEPTGEIAATGPDAEVAGEPMADEEEDDDDFFSEQRLSDELNQALEAPITDEHEAPSTGAPAPVFPETDEHETFTDTDEHDAAPPETDEHDAGPPSEEHTAIYDAGDHGSHEEDDELEDEDDEPARRSAQPEDVLEDTPDFLEDAPEDDELWFEQKPPKDFDFDD